jgi:hypothetical protein
LNRILLVLLLAGAAQMPMAASGQVARESQGGPGDQAAAPLKYEIFAGMAYTSLNQVNLSRYGLIGEKVGVMRNWGRFFGLAGTGDYERYGTDIKGAGGVNPGDPSVYSFLVAPEIHGYDLIGHVGAVLFAEMGGEHTGGEHMTPTVSFAGGFGGGATYSINQHLGIRLTGDRLAGSFSLTGNSPGLALSSHKTWNPRFSIGATYRFNGFSFGK